jgi:hypothetical protein
MTPAVPQKDTEQPPHPSFTRPLKEVVGIFTHRLHCFQPWSYMTMLYVSISCQALKLRWKLNHLCRTKTLHGILKTENDKVKNRTTVGFHNVNK